MKIMEIRENGIGSNFRVINPADGFRKDNRLWFGTCSVCNGRVINSSFKGVWEHSVTTENGNMISIRRFEDCPSA
jgi:hypothetical protein